MIAFTQTTTQKPERRKFRMDAALLWSVIQSQAGTAEKALLEAVMNAVDAKATKCNITVTETGYVVVDDGEGFKSRNEIESFFETFGTPHNDGDATYGTYRMGRGQLFAFSQTTWESGLFTMVVDIKAMGLEYDLHNNDTPAPGCSITGTWYEPIDSAEVIRIGFELKQLAKWMQIPVILNGKKLNKEPENEEWTTVTDDAYIKLKTTGGLMVYNLGALVRTYPDYQFGTSGIIVSRQQLSVNFARNDILLSKCDVWRRIRRILDKHCGKLVQKKTPLSGYEYRAVASRYARGEIQFSDVSQLGLLQDVSGKRRSLNELSRAQKLCVVPDEKDWTIGERAMNQNLAFVIRSNAIHQFGVETVEDFLELMKARVTPSRAEVQAYASAQAKYKERSLAQTALCQQASNGLYPYHEAHPQHSEYLRLEKLSYQADSIKEEAFRPLKNQKRFDHVWHWRYCIVGMRNALWPSTAGARAMCFRCRVATWLSCRRTTMDWRTTTGKALFLTHKRALMTLIVFNIRGPALCTGVMFLSCSWSSSPQ